MRRFSLIALFLLQSIAAIGAEAGAVNTICPVTPEEAIDPKVTTTFEGMTIALCCKTCLRKFNRNPAAYLANLSIVSNGPAIPASTETTENEHIEAHDLRTGPAATLANTNESAHRSIELHSAGSKGSHANPEDFHDHSTDHTSKLLDTPTSTRIATLLGKFHVLSIHLPIALLPIAALCELIGWTRRRDSILHFGRICFVLGAIGAFVAVTFGWFAALDASYTGQLSDYLGWHRWSGTLSGLLAILGLLSLLAQRLGLKWGLTLYRGTVLVIGVAITVTAHLGGSLIYGPDYLF